MTLIARLLSFSSGDFDLIYRYGLFSNSYPALGTPGMSTFRVKQKKSTFAYLLAHSGAVLVLLLLDDRHDLTL